MTSAAELARRERGRPGTSGRAYEVGRGTRGERRGGVVTRFFGRGLTTTSGIDTDAAAVFSGDGRYRYSLRRQISPDGVGTCAFVMLNPSTADELNDDPTIRRCVGFARRWGFSELLVANLFALRATVPSALRAAVDPVGPLNDEWLGRVAASADVLVCGWGNDGAWQGRAGEVVDVLGDRELWSLGVTATGQPRHPLYARGDARLVRFKAAARA